MLNASTRNPGKTKSLKLPKESVNNLFEITWVQKQITT
jgi:hypothetical protein